MANAQCSDTSALQLDTHADHSSERTADASTLHAASLPHATAYGSSTGLSFGGQQVSWAGAPRTRLHPDLHATPTRPSNPSTAPPSPVSRPHAAAATAAALLEADRDDLGHRSQARRCQRVHQICVARSLVHIGLFCQNPCINAIKIPSGLRHVLCASAVGGRHSMK